MQRMSISLMLAAATLAASAAALAAPSALPGDRGRPMEGLLPAPSARPPGEAAQPGRAAGPPRPQPAVAPAIELALKAAQAIAEACRQYPLGVAVVDTEGVARLIYVPDQSEAWHGYSAVRKAYTAVMFKEPTSKLASEARDNPALREQIKADPNLQAFPGGLPVMANGKLVGAIGVSGAEPGGHDEECGLAGVAVLQPGSR